MTLTYGKSSSGNYAICLKSNKQHGVWDVVEAVGDFYRIVNFDEIPECDWDRIDNLVN